MCENLKFSYENLIFAPLKREFLCENLRFLCEQIEFTPADGLWRLELNPLRRGIYDVLELDRDELVGKLRRLAEWAQAVTVNPDLYVLHLGI